MDEGRAVRAGLKQIGRTPTPNLSPQGGEEQVAALVKVLAQTTDVIGVHGAKFLATPRPATSGPA